MSMSQKISFVSKANVYLWLKYILEWKGEILPWVFASLWWERGLRCMCVHREGGQFLDFFTLEKNGNGGLLCPLLFYWGKLLSAMRTRWKPLLLNVRTDLLALSLWEQNQQWAVESCHYCGRPTEIFHRCIFKTEEWNWF